MCPGFSCKDGLQCVIKRFHCDGKIDCNDGSDEENCNKEEYDRERLGLAPTSEPYANQPKRIRDYIIKAYEAAGLSIYD